MKKTYKISGMTCNSCKATVHQNLNELKEIKAVEVSLEKSEARAYHEMDLRGKK